MQIINAFIHVSEMKTQIMSVMTNGPPELSPSRHSKNNSCIAKMT